MIVSHRWRGKPTESTYFSDKYYFYFQGLTLVDRCSQLSVPGSRRRERRFSKAGPEVEIA